VFRFMRRPRRTALVAVGALVVAGLTATANPAHAAIACQVNYQKAWDNGGGGFGANLTIINLGDPLTSWTLTFSFANGQTVQNGWNGRWSQSGANVTVVNESWNGNLPTNAQVGPAFNGNYIPAQGNTNPTAFSLNGVACTGPQQPQTLIVNPTSVTVPENNTATFTVRLGTQPTSNVLVNTTAGTGDASLTVSSGATLTFTSANWNVNQTVTLAAAEDPDTTSDSRTFTVSAANAPSVTVTATERDNDVPQRLIVNPTTLNVPEGNSVPFAVSLAAQPAANVTVTTTAGTGDADLTVASGGSLIFTPTNFGTPQNVTIAAAADADSAPGTRPFTVSANLTGVPSVTVTATEIDAQQQQNAYIADFMTQYNKIKNPANGYLSPEGIPYHAIETLIVEAPDHGHETTSEAFSFLIWLEAQFGRITGQWAPFNAAWNLTEQFIIPSAAGQPGGSSSYNPSDPADYAPERPQPSQYPVALSTSVIAGSDPLASELQTTYGNRNMYAMHWLLDVDDVYGYGTGRTAAECGDNTQRVTYINTYQRGPQESVWETVAHPSCETGRFGQSGSGYPPLFIQGGGANQWRYTDAPDADARAVQATYWALQWATAQGPQAVATIQPSLTKAAKMGDFLRYSFFDKYFKNPGCTSTACTPGSGKSSSSYMLTWYFSWGGDIGGAWAWRIGSSSWHQGYQNPLAAFVLSQSGPTALRPQSASAPGDWTTSLSRQLDSYLWLQSAEGGIAGGATNSVNGNYEAPAAGTPNFFGWFYDFQPVFHDPPSNQWFGFQVWSMERVAEYYWVTGDTKAKRILDRWVPWAIQNTTLGTGTNFSFPSDMSWSGAPAASYTTSTAAGPGANPGLHVTVVNTSNDVGVGAAYARTLTWYAAKEGATTLGTQAKNTAKGLLDRMSAMKTADPSGRGITVSETRSDYNRFDDVWNSSTQTGLFIPSSFTGSMPSGATINSSSTFMSIRPFYATDPAWAPVQAYINGTGSAPSFRYHRFWAQADIAMAFADFGSLFPAG